MHKEEVKKCRMPEAPAGSTSDMCVRSISGVDGHFSLEDKGRLALNEGAASLRVNCDTEYSAAGGCLVC